jgi:hypothetical protein
MTIADALPDHARESNLSSVATDVSGGFLPEALNE